jgi:hypothetical protein
MNYPIYQNIKIENIKGLQLPLYQGIFSPNTFILIQILNEAQIQLFIKYKDFIEENNFIEYNNLNNNVIFTENVFRSQVVYSNRNPVWEVEEILLRTLKKVIVFQIWDYDNDDDDQDTSLMGYSIFKIKNNGHFQINLNTMGLIELDFLILNEKEIKKTYLFFNNLLNSLFYFYFVDVEFLF